MICVENTIHQNYFSKLNTHDTEQLKKKMMMMMMMLILLQLLNVASMDPSTIRWTKGYDFGEEAHPHAGVETFDGGFLMVGTLRFIHTRTHTLKHTHTHTHTHTHKHTHDNRRRNEIR